jgi:serine/threonine protein kinase
LASGSTAVIYLAMFRGTDGLERPVVIKRIHPYLASRMECVEACFDEAQLAALLSHPAVCALYDFGRTDQTYFLAMEYLIGETFDRVAKRAHASHDSALKRRLPHFAARLAADVCEGLHAVHTASDTTGNCLQIVHADLTPRNLFVLYDGSVRITDFGSARSRDRRYQAGVGLGKGKVAYMAPEQLGHQPVDQRSDIWSFGIVFWELLTGEKLFASDTISATVEAVYKLRVPPPSSKNPLVPTDLDTIVSKALARDPNARYANAREMARALEAFLSSCKDPISPYDRITWLDGLFPGEAQRQSELVRVARSMVEQARPAPPPLPSAPAADSGTNLPVANEPQNDNASARLSAPRSLALRQRLPLTAAMIGGLVLALLVMAGLLYHAQSIAPDAASSSPPSGNAP